MLGFAIRIKDERGDTFYKNRFNLLNNFLMGDILEDARFFIERESAETKLALLNDFLKMPYKNKKIEDFLKEINSKFHGFEIVEVEFSEIYYYLILTCDANKISYVRDIKVENAEDCVIFISSNIDTAIKFISYTEAMKDIEALEEQHFPFAKNLKIKFNFVKPRVFE